MTDYISTVELRQYIGSATTNFEPVAESACTTASRLVEAVCDRVFTTASTATPRYFTPYDYSYCEVDDFYTTDSLVVATNDSGTYGTYSTAWTIGTDFTPVPVNSTAGAIAVPYHELRAVGGKGFWRSSWETVSVTAKWGWPTVPTPVRQATLMLAAQLFKMKDAPDGFVGLDGWGPARVRENPMIRAVLGPYMKHPIAVRMNIPDVLAGFVAMLAPCDVEVYGYFPDVPNVPCLVVFLETVPFDLTQDSTYVIRIVGGTTEMQGAENNLFGLMTEILALIDADNTLGGVVSSVLPLEVRDWGIAPTQEGRTRYLQADIVCGVLTQ